MRIANHANLAPETISALERALSACGTLQEIVAWGRAQQPPLLLTDTIAQDEFTHDVIAVWRDAHDAELTLVCGAT